jgi:CheY-like chemotaxis protein
VDEASSPPATRDSSQAGASATDHDLAGALHEVSNGLTVILGWLEVAREQLDLAVVAPTRAPSDSVVDAAGARAREALEVAIVRSRRAHRIARRAISTPSPIVDAPELLGAIVHEAVQGIAPEAERCAIALESRVSSELGALPIESGDRLLQVLTNLLLNALIATPESGTITVSVDRGDDASLARVSVSDGGPGIPARDRGRLFQRGSTGRVGGAGIGLAHARDVVEELGGYLELLPYREGQGAHFVIAWPCARAIEPERTSAPVARSDDARLSDVSVVVLDDDAAVVELLELSLGARGAEVAGFDELPSLERHLREARTDVVLLDASPLRGEPLDRVLGRLRHIRPNLGVVLISGAADPGCDTSALGVSWMRKPFDLAELAAEVRRAATSAKLGATRD